MRVFWLILVTVLTVGSSFGQELFPIRSDVSTKNSSYARMTSYFVAYDSEPALNSETINGSAYLHDEYRLGSILQNDKVLFENIPIKYNIYNDLMLTKESFDAPDDSAQAIIKSEAYQIKIEEDVFMAMPDPDEPNEFRYFQVLSMGRKVDLYKKYNVNFNPEVIATTSLTRSVPANFKQSSAYFLKDITGNVRPISEKRSKMAVVFGEYKQTMTNVISKYKLDMSDEKDLVRIIRYYNTL